MAIDPASEVTAPYPDRAHGADAYLIALHPSLMHREYAVRAGRIVLGRDAPACDFTVAGPTISRRHCEIVQRNGAFTVQDLGSRNGVYVNGKKIDRETGLNDGDVVGLGSAEKAHFRFQRESGRGRPWMHVLPKKDSWTIGRASKNDIALPFESAVSSLHTTLRPKSGRIELQDHNSLNGVWVNGRRVKRATLDDADAITVGSTVLRCRVLEDGRLEVTQRDCGEGVALECVDVTWSIRSGPVWNRREKTILDKVCLAIRPGEFVGLLGPSGAGKSTLLKALNGVQPPNYGCVLLNDMPLYRSLGLYKTWLGYVPQDDIVHRELTVEQTLDFTARLRLPKDVTAEQRTELIDNTIESLGLSHVRGTRVYELSGGQRKRVSIGCELLTRPSVLFLDEPTSGMDPSTEERLMRMFKNMAAGGTTVLITTHILYNLPLLDRVVIMSRGKLVFFGTPDDARTFFGAEESPTRIFDLLEGEAEVPGLAADKQRDKNAIAEHYHELYMNSETCRRNLDGQLSNFARELRGDARTTRGAGKTAGTDTTQTRNRRALLEKPVARRIERPSLNLVTPRSLVTLMRRNFAIKLVSPSRLLFYLSVPIVLALVTATLGTGNLPNDEELATAKLGIQAQISGGQVDIGEPIKALLSPEGAADPRTATDIVYSLRHEGLANLPTPISVLLMFVMMAVFTGTLASCLDISTERPIYARERMANLKIAEYIGSKLPFLLALTAVQCALFLLLCRFVLGYTTFDLVPAYCGLVAMSWTACAIGLFISALDPTAGQLSVILAIVAVLPQLVFSGGLGPDFYEGMNGGIQRLADLTPARWGLELLMTAFYNHPDHESLGWIKGFVENDIGFDFGPEIYRRNVGILAGQTVGWLVFCGLVLRLRDRAA